MIASKQQENLDFHSWLFISTVNYLKECNYLTYHKRQGTKSKQSIKIPICTRKELIYVWIRICVSFICALTSGQETLQKAYLRTKGHCGETCRNCDGDSSVVATKDSQAKSLGCYLCKLIQPWSSFTWTLNLATWKNLKIATNDTLVSLPGWYEQEKRVLAWLWLKPYVNRVGSFTSVCKCLFTRLSAGSWGGLPRAGHAPTGL